MASRRTPGRCVGVWVFLWVVWVFPACDGLLVEPASSEAGDGIQLVLAHDGTSGPGYGDPVAVMMEVDEARFLFIRGDEVRDTTVRGRAEDGRFRARIRLRPDEAKGWLEVQAELRSRRRPLFRGRAVIQTYRASPNTRIEVIPVPASVSVHADRTTVRALGDTVELEAVARFHTGDPIDEPGLEWSSEDPDILEVIPGPRAVPRANGTASIRATVGEASGGATITVFQSPSRLTGVAPADTLVDVGDTFQLRPFGEDRNGYPLLPGADVEWVYAGTVVTVDGRGVVTASEPGSASIEAVLNGNRHVSEVTVLAP